MTIYKHCDVTLRYTISDIPTGLTAAKAIWMLKITASDPDEAAILSKTATPTNASGTAVADIPITDAEASALDAPRRYVAALKLILSNGDAVAVDCNTSLDAEDYPISATA